MSEMGGVELSKRTQPQPPEPRLDDNDEIATIEVRLLLEAIHARYGYDLRDYAAGSMGRRVFAALHASGFSSLGELQHHLLRDHNLFADVLDRLTIRVSEMFRDPELYRSLRTEVVPLLRTYPLLKIWTAGCATGEEAYSSAILLLEADLYERTQIYATDLSAHALSLAKEGVYGVSSLVTFEENHRASEPPAGSAVESHITVAYDQIAMRESLRKNILFFQHNLVSDHVFGEMHLVFCRNVLIYFSPVLRERVLDKIRQSLVLGGFLCLGKSERLPESSHSHFARISPNHPIYQRRS